jgi:DNA-binding NtrC family response regulator
MKMIASREIGENAIEVLQTYPWPGNVRQLRHIVEQLVVDTCRIKLIDADAVHRVIVNHPTGLLRSGSNAQPLARYTEGESLDDFLDRTMLDLYDTLKSRNGTHSQTARQLRTDRVALYQRLLRARRRLQSPRPW